jgi:membrane protease YdiL (CAAX protease family)
MTDFVGRHSLVLFLLFAIVIGWFWWIQMVLGFWPVELIIIPSSLGGISPILTLMILQKYSDHTVDVDKIFNTTHTWRKGILWLVLSALMIPTVTTVGNMLSFIVGNEAQLNLLNPERVELGLALIAIVPLTFFPGLLTSPLFEEPGWRGFALPKLQAKFGREVGSLIIGSYWWIWHQMSNVYWGLYPTPISYLSMLGYSFTIDSLFNLSKRNLLAAMFAHQSLFIANTYLYKKTNDLSALLILSIIWTSVLVLRIFESRHDFQESLTF